MSTSGRGHRRGGRRGLAGLRRWYGTLMTQTLARPQHPDPIRTGRWIEPFTERIERTKWLAQLSHTAATVAYKVLKPGPFKDFLSGTWTAHPLHPMLTDVAIGAWTSGVFLDLMGEEQGADALIGAGV